MTDDNRGSEGGMRVDAELVRQLAELLNENELTEIEVQDGERRIVVKRQLLAAAAAPAPAAAAPAPAGTAAPSPASPLPGTADLPASAHPGALKSPMVGTVYLSGEPGAKPFVAPGQQVSEGETLLIVEAMKVMNPIVSPRAGTVTRILVQDAQPVEYDQPLLIIE
jgi:acetyl-CoA carboxylase biotin carboxyl carrier protein